MRLSILALFFGLAFADAPASVNGRAAAQNQAVSNAEYSQDLDLLRKYLQTRGEKDADIELFIGDLAKTEPPRRDVLAAFLKYEQSWARKTRDAKNPLVKPDQLAHEKQRAEELKLTFRKLAKAQAPGFLDAFRGAIKHVRAAHGASPTTSISGDLFADQTDDSYTHVDNADEALDNGDATTAAQEAQQALAENPQNADALAVQAGAALAQGDPVAAAQAAQSALALDPANQTAQAIASLAGGSISTTERALTDAGAMSGNLQGAAAPVPFTSFAVAPPAPGTPPPPPASATPLLAANIAAQVGQQAARTSNIDPAAGMKEIARAIQLDPSNPDLWSLQAKALQRAGDYRDAVAAASRAVELAPKAARYHYAKAEALAFDREKTGMVDELRQAAALDSSYQPVVNSAIQLPDDADLTLLFPDSQSPLSSPPPAHRHRHRKAWRLFWIVLGALGSGLVLAGIVYGALADREERRAFVA